MTVVQFDYRGLSIVVETTTLLNAVSGHADLFKDNVHKCRLGLTTASIDRECFVDALSVKARDYVDAWILREHSGDTDFQNL